MAYQVIARKYRPQRFSDVVGQDHVATTLANAIQMNRIAHAYLFCGPRGTGKTTIARIFAKCLNCTGGPKVDFEDADPRVAEIAEGRSLDVIEIDGASNRGIQEIRELRDTVKYAPAAAKFKIYIIDEVHMLTTEAFNALLKTLEEPPAHVKFMFATTEPEKVLPTILSRCQRFDLRRIPSALIVKHLALIARQEKVTLDDAALFAIARGADGGMRDAESTLDQLISFCGDHIEESDVLSMFGMSAQGQIAQLAEALFRADGEAALRGLDELCRAGKELGRLLSDLLAHCRNLLLFQLTKGDLSLLQVSEAEVATLRAAANQVEVSALARIVEVLSEYEGRVREAASRRIVLEVGLLKAIEALRAVAVDDLLRQLQQLRGSSGGETPASVSPSAPAPAARAAKPQAAAPAAAPTPAPAAPAPSPAPPARSNGAAAAPVTDLPGLYAALLEAIGRTSPFVRGYLLEGHPVSFGQGAFVIGYDPALSDQLELVNNERNRDMIRARLEEMGHAGVQVRFVKHVAEAENGLPAPTPPVAVSAPVPVSAPLPAPAAKPAEEPRAAAKPRPEPVQMSQEELKNDPLIQKALDLFKGQLAGIVRP